MEAPCPCSALQWLQRGADCVLASSLPRPQAAQHQAPPGAAAPGIHPYWPTPRCFSADASPAVGSEAQGGSSPGADGYRALAAVAGRALAGRWVRKDYLEGVGLLGHACSASRAEGTLRGVCVEGEDDDEYVWLPWRCHLAASSLLHSLGALRQRASVCPSASVCASAARPRRILMAGRLLVVCWFRPRACLGRWLSVLACLCVCARVFGRGRASPVARILQSGLAGVGLAGLECDSVALVWARGWRQCSGRPVRVAL